MECPSCRDKPGMAKLCASCNNNRNQIENLEDEVIYWKGKLAHSDNILDILWNILKVKKDA